MNLIISIIPLFIAIIVHELAHAWVADRAGDHTARLLGRLTLNPFKHIDLVGSILVPSFFFLTTGLIFGWAKPIPVQTNMISVNDKRRVLVAGILSNFLQSIVWLVFLFIVLQIKNVQGSFISVLISMANFGIFINILLAIFNAIPFWPLDGGRFIQTFFPSTDKFFFKIEANSQSMFIVTLTSVLVASLLMLNFLIPVSKHIYKSMLLLIG